MTNDKLAVQSASLEIAIIELDERLDMAIDPLMNALALNIKCKVNNGCNTVAGCGSPAPNQ